MKLSFFLIAFGCSLVCAAQKPGPVSDLAAFIRSKGDSLYKAANLQGLFVGVLNGGQRRYFNFGYAVPDQKIPFDPAMVFEAGSITKTLTAYLLQSVLTARRISDGASILPYLPDSVQKNKALASVTFLSLMNHTSGLPRLPDNLPLSGPAPYDDYTAADLFSCLKTCVPKPDGKSNYSNLGMGLAGVLAQRITGKSYETLLRTYRLRPFDGQQAAQKKRRRAQGHFNGQKQAFWNMNVLAPAGGLQCSADDMLTYLQNMSLPGRYAAAVVEELLQATAVVSPTMHVCRAWHTFEQKGKPVIYWHNGGTYGFSTFAAFLKNTGQAVIVVANRFNANEVSDGLGMAIMKKFSPM